LKKPTTLAIAALELIRINLLCLRLLAPGECGFLHLQAIFHHSRFYPIKVHFFLDCGGSRSHVKEFQIKYTKADFIVETEFNIPNYF
jgi:hypothetical protein